MQGAIVQVERGGLTEPTRGTDSQGKRHINVAVAGEINGRLWMFHTETAIAPSAEPNPEDSDRATGKVLDPKHKGILFPGDQVIEVAFGLFDEPAFCTVEG